MCQLADSYGEATCCQKLLIVWLSVMFPVEGLYLLVTLRNHSFCLATDTQPRDLFHCLLLMAISKQHEAKNIILLKDCSFHCFKTLWVTAQELHWLASKKLIGDALDIDYAMIHFIIVIFLIFHLISF